MGLIAAIGADVGAAAAADVGFAAAADVGFAAADVGAIGAEAGISAAEAGAISSGVEASLAGFADVGAAIDAGAIGAESAAAAAVGAESLGGGFAGEAGLGLESAIPGAEASAASVGGAVPAAGGATALPAAGGVSSAVEALGGIQPGVFDAVGAPAADISAGFAPDVGNFGFTFDPATGGLSPVSGVSDTGLIGQSTDLGAFGTTNAPSGFGVTEFPSGFTSADFPAGSIATQDFPLSGGVIAPDVQNSLLTSQGIANDFTGFSGVPTDAGATGVTTTPADFTGTQNLGLTSGDVNLTSAAGNVATPFETFGTPEFAQNITSAPQGQLAGEISGGATAPTIPSTAVNTNPAISALGGTEDIVNANLADKITAGIQADAARGLPAATGGIGDVFSMKNLPLAIGAAGLGATLIRGEPSLPPQALQAEGQANDLNAMGLQNLRTAQSGQITPQQAALIEINKEKSINQAYQMFARMGRDPSNDTDYLQMVASINANALAQQEQFIQQMINTGLTETGQANQDLLAVAQMQMASDTAFQQSLMGALSSFGLIAALSGINARVGA